MQLYVFFLVVDLRTRQNMLYIYFNEENWELKYPENRKILIFKYKTIDEMMRT